MGKVEMVNTSRLIKMTKTLEEHYWDPIQHDLGRRRKSGMGLSLLGLCATLDRLYIIYKHFDDLEAYYFFFLQVF